MSNENMITKASELLQKQENLEVNNGSTMQRMQTAYSTAVSVQKPRQLDKIIGNVMRESEYAGEDFFYAWGEGKNHVEGNSVSLALTVVREWGNCAVETNVEETSDSYIFTAHFVDLETGFTLSRSFRQSKKWQVYGKLDDARKDDIRFQIGQSKAIRNVISNAMPKWLLNQAREKAKESLEKNITKEGVVLATEKAISALARYGVAEERVLSKLKKCKNQIVMSDIIDLRTAYAAIKNGEATAEDIFPKVEGEKGSSKFESNSELNMDNVIKDAEVVHDVKSPEITKDTVVQMLKEANAPVTFADIEAYMKQNENLPYTVNLENNQLKMKMVYNGLNSIVNKTLTWLENQKK